MSEELKPCLRCGSDRVTVMNIRDGQQAICKDCKSSGPPIFHGPGRAEDPLDTWKRAVAAWNQRAKPVVKALVWEGYWAATPYGPYSIWKGFVHESGRWCVAWNGTVIAHAHTEDEAKAAAQADFTRRVHACLEGYDD